MEQWDAGRVWRRGARVGRWSRRVRRLSDGLGWDEWSELAYVILSFPGFVVAGLELADAVVY